MKSAPAKEGRLTMFSEWEQISGKQFEALAFHKLTEKPSLRRARGLPAEKKRGTSVIESAGFCVKRAYWGEVLWWASRSSSSWVLDGRCLKANVQKARVRQSVWEGKDTETRSEWLHGTIMRRRQSYQERVPGSKVLCG